MKKFVLIFVLFFVTATTFNTSANAAGLLGFNDPPGCESKDPLFPSLVICGRSPSTGACQQYTKECGLGDLVQTGSRVLVWIITLFLLIIPLFIMYYGAMMIIYRNMEMPGQLKKVKDRFWEILIYFILMLAAWLIVRTVVDVFQVDKRINTFLIDENGNTVKARTFNTN
jgi:hypothetical protein